MCVVVKLAHMHTFTLHMCVIIKLAHMHTFHADTHAHTHTHTLEQAEYRAVRRIPEGQQV